jgi:hypothetical protein
MYVLVELIAEETPKPTKNDPCNREENTKSVMLPNFYRQRPPCHCDSPDESDKHLWHPLGKLCVRRRMFRMHKHTVDCRGAAVEEEGESKERGSRRRGGVEGGEEGYSTMCRVPVQRKYSDCRRPRQNVVSECRLEERRDEISLSKLRRT